MLYKTGFAGLGRGAGVLELGRIGGTGCAKPVQVQAGEKRELLRCASSFVLAEYYAYASLLAGG